MDAPNIFEALRVSIEEISGRKVSFIDKALRNDGVVCEPSGLIYLSIDSIEMLGHHVYQGFSVSYHLSMFLFDSMAGIVIPQIFELGLSDIENSATVATYTVRNISIPNLLAVAATSHVILDRPDIAKKEISAIHVKINDNKTIIIGKNGTKEIKETADDQ